MNEKEKIHYMAVLEAIGETIQAKNDLISFQKYEIDSLRRKVSELEEALKQKGETEKCTCPHFLEQ